MRRSANERPDSGPTCQPDPCIRDLVDRRCMVANLEESVLQTGHLRQVSITALVQPSASTVRALIVGFCLGEICKPRQILAELESLGNLEPEYGRGNLLSELQHRGIVWLEICGLLHVP